MVRAEEAIMEEVTAAITAVTAAEEAAVHPFSFQKNRSKTAADSDILILVAEQNMSMQAVYPGVRVYSL